MLTYAYFSQQFGTVFGIGNIAGVQFANNELAVTVNNFEMPRHINLPNDPSVPYTLDVY